MPPNAIEVKYHPSSVNLLLIKKLAEESIEKRENFFQFLTRRFSSIDAKLANNVIRELGNEYNGKLLMSSFTENMYLNMSQLFKQMIFPTPDGSCLSPAGEYNLRLGIMKELDPDMIATFTEKCRVFEGHPFVVEAAVSLGGKSVNPVRRDFLIIYLDA